MLNFFDTLIEYFKVFLTFIENLGRGLMTAITTLLSALADIPILIGLVPSFLSVSMLIAVSVVVINYLIGRDNK